MNSHLIGSGSLGWQEEVSTGTPNYAGTRRASAKDHRWDKNKEVILNA